MILLAEYVTPEGLGVQQIPAEDGWTVVQEVGKLGYAIYQYRIREEDPEVILGYVADHSGSFQFLLARLEELDRRCEEMRAATPTPIDLPAWRWNRKRAARRFRRWVRENDLAVLEAPERVHALVARVLADEGEVVTQHDTEWWLSKLFAEGGISELEEYDRRKRERVTLVVSQLDDAVRLLLAEANEAYFHGLFRATVALCRAVLEDTVKRVVRAQRVTPARKSFCGRIACIPIDLWSEKAAGLARDVWKKGSNAMHDSDVEFSEDEAWRILVLTTRLIQVLVNRGGLLERVD